LGNGQDQRRKYGYSPERVSQASDAGPVRPANEDAYYVPAEGVDPRLGTLYIVADGVGGQEHGRYAADLAVQTIPTFFYEFRRSGNGLSVSLTYALKEANKIIYDEAQSRGEGRMGCTVVAIAQEGDRLWAVHVGDARAYLARKGRLKRLTRDHTWVQEQVDAGTLTGEEAANHELRNVVTRVLGNKAEVDVELSGPFQVEPDNLMLLCSDGLYDALSEREIYKIVQSNPPVQSAGVLIRAAVRAGAGDNVTAIVAAAGQKTRSAFGQLLAYTLPGGIPLILPFILLFLGAFFSTMLIRGGSQEQPPSLGPLLPTVGPNPTLTGISVPTGRATAESSATRTAEVALALTPLVNITTPLAAEANFGCVVPGTYFWKDELYQDDEDLCENTHDSWPDDPNAILLTDPKDPKSIVGFTGYLPAGGYDCAQLDMIKVKSVSDSEFVGWVLAEKAWAFQGSEETCDQ